MSPTVTLGPGVGGRRLRRGVVLWGRVGYLGRPKCHKTFNRFVWVTFFYLALSFHHYSWGFHSREIMILHHKTTLVNGKLYLFFCFCWFYFYLLLLPILSEYSLKPIWPVSVSICKPVYPNTIITRLRIVTHIKLWNMHSNMHLKWS